MVGGQRLVRHWWVTGIAAGVLLVLSLLVLMRAVPANTITQLALGVGVLAFLAHYFVYQSNPNRNLEGNQSRALQDVEAGGTQLCQPDPQAKGVPEVVRTDRSGTARTIFALMVVAICAIGSGEMVRTISGWHYNSNCYPPVAGPGDTILVYFAEKFASVKGLWRGNATAEFLNAAEVGYDGPAPRAASQANNWGGRISVKPSEKSTTVTPKAYVELPLSPALADKPVQLKIDLEVEFPALIGGDKFEVVTQTFSQVGDLRLASANAGSTYQQLWWGGTLGGGLMLLAMGFWLTRIATALRREALPTSVTPCE
jgi:hypothetical protein